MKTKIYAIAAVVMIVSACTKIQSSDKNSIDETNKTAFPSVLSAYPKKWGVIVNQSAPSTDSIDWTNQSKLSTASSRVTEALNLGVTYYRMPIVDSNWSDVSGGAMYQSNRIAEFKNANQRGLTVLLNLLWKPAGDNHPLVNFPAGDVTNNASEMYQYQTFVRDVLHRCDSMHYKPAFIVVENEENNPTYYNIVGTSQYLQYEKELSTAKAVCDTSHWQIDHSAGVNCTNGGITATNLIYAAYHYYVVNNSTSLLPGFQSWAYKVLPPNFYYGLINMAPPAGSGITPASPAFIKAYISIVDSLVSYYSSISLPYVNMHWYEPIRAREWNIAANGGIDPYSTSSTYGHTSKDTVGANGLDSAALFLTKKCPSASIMSNEVGQLTFSTCLTQALLNTSNTYLSYVTLYDGDGADYSYGAKAYHNTLNVAPDTTATIRAIGTTLHTQITSGSPTVCP